MSPDDEVERAQDDDWQEVSKSNGDDGQDDIFCVFHMTVRILVILVPQPILLVPTHHKAKVVDERHDPEHNDGGKRVVFGPVHPAHQRLRDGHVSVHRHQEQVENTILDTKQVESHDDVTAEMRKWPEVTGHDAVGQEWDGEASNEEISKRQRDEEVVGDGSEVFVFEEDKQHLE